MSNTAQLRNLCQILKPLMDVPAALDRIESAEQSVRSAEAQLAKTRKEHADLKAKSVALDEAMQRREAQMSEMGKSTSAARAQILSDAEKQAAELVDDAKKTASQMVGEAKAKAAEITALAKNIDATIHDKKVELEKIEGKISKAKDQLRRMLGAAGD
jgi:cell division septum initiation protein DivIVA